MSDRPNTIVDEIQPDRIAKEIKEFQARVDNEDLKPAVEALEAVYNEAFHKSQQVDGGVTAEEAKAIKHYCNLVHLCEMAGREDTTEAAYSMFQIASELADNNSALAELGNERADYIFVEQHMDSVFARFKEAGYDDERFKALIDAVEEVLPHVQLRIMQRDGLTPN